MHREEFVPCIHNMQDNGTSKAHVHANVLGPSRGSPGQNSKLIIGYSVSHDLVEVMCSRGGLG